MGSLKDDYISRKATIANSREYNLGGSYDNTERAVPVDAIKSIPAADVREVVRGKWHSRFYYRESTKAYDCEMHVCSECGSEWSYDAETGSSDFNYCPNCGADMREGN